VPSTSPPVAGLTRSEAALRLSQDGPNVLPGAMPKTLLAIVLGVITEPMFVMLLVAGGVYFALGDHAEAVFLLTFVFVVIGITLMQERKTQRALESLRDLSAPRAMVIRDGEEVRVAGREVVRGDALVLHEGDRVAADALLVEGHLSVNESLLTGEAVPVTKLPSLQTFTLGAPGGDGTPALFASTVVTKGVGLAVVQRTGATTAVGRIGQALATTEETASGLQRSSRTLIRNLGDARATASSPSSTTSMPIWVRYLDGLPSAGTHAPRRGGQARLHAGDAALPRSRAAPRLRARRIATLRRKRRFDVSPRARPDAASNEAVQPSAWLGGPTLSSPR